MTSRLDELRAMREAQFKGTPAPRAPTPDELRARVAQVSKAAAPVKREKQPKTAKRVAPKKRKIAR